MGRASPDIIVVTIRSQTLIELNYSPVNAPCLLRNALVLCASLTIGACGLFGPPDPLPEARFYVGCISIVDSNVSFVNRSLHATKYEWRFGDGRTSTDRDPTLVFTRSDSIDVTLTASNEDGDADSKTVRVFINPPIPPTHIIPFDYVGAYDRYNTWAAVVASVLAHYGDSVRQCAIVAEYHEVDCCKPDTKCTSWLSRDVMADGLLKNGPLASTVRDGVFLMSEFKSEIAQNNPVIIWYLGHDVYHSLVVHGYDSTGKLYTMDPELGSGVTTLDGLLRLQFGPEYLEWSATIHCIRKPT